MLRPKVGLQRVQTMLQSCKLVPVMYPGRNVNPFYSNQRKQHLVGKEGLGSWESYFFPMRLRCTCKGRKFLLLYLPGVSILWMPPSEKPDWNC